MALTIQLYQHFIDVQPLHLNATCNTLWQLPATRILRSTHFGKGPQADNQTVKAGILRIQQTATACCRYLLDSAAGHCTEQLHVLTLSLLMYTTTNAHGAKRCGLTDSRLKPRSSICQGDNQKGTGRSTKVCQTQSLEVQPKVTKLAYNKKTKNAQSSADSNKRGELSLRCLSSEQNYHCDDQA